jgi:hypothetical protein
MATDKGSRVNPELDKYLKTLLKEVMRKSADPSKDASLTDKMKVIDRVLKWEQVKANMNDGEWGAAFADD